MRGTILLINADNSGEEAIAEAIGKQPFDVLVGSSLEEAERWLNKGKIDIVIADEDTLDPADLTRLARAHPHLIRILSTNSQERGVPELMNGIVHRVLLKSWTGDAVRSVLQDAIELAAIRLT